MQLLSPHHAQKHYSRGGTEAGRPGPSQPATGNLYFFLLNRVYRGFFKCHTLRKQIKCFGYKTDKDAVSLIYNWKPHIFIF